MGRRSHGVEWEKDNEERIIKFGEYVFRLMYHSTVTIAGLCFFLDAPWWDEKQGGVGATLHHHPHHEIGVEMIWYYMIQGAYNVEAMLSLSELSFDIKFRSMFSKEGKIQSPVKIGWSDTCRGDFTEMFAHHVITNLLVIGSSHLRFSRIGTMVFMVHDISDVPVDVSKLLNFMKWKYMTISAFAILMITWIVTRLYILPFVIVKGIFDTCHLLYENEDIPATYYSKILVVFKGLLISITSLHVLWFVILLRILLKVITKGETHDLSEHKNGEDQLNVKSNKNKTL
jgi:ceramide synthetase